VTTKTRTTVDAARVEILRVLAGEERDVLARLEEVTDHLTLVALHLAERQKGRRRKPVLQAIEARGLALELAPVNVAAAHLQEDVVRAVAGMQLARPEASPLDRDLLPDEIYPTPADYEFVDDETGRAWDYMRAPDLAGIAADVLQEQTALLQPALDFSIQFLWKRTGGESGGNAVLGRCVKFSGLSAFFANDEFLIWVAADHARDYGLTRHQVEALLFHELKHVDRSERYTPKTRGHEVEMFIDEVRVYGAWKADLRRMVEQLRLPIGDQP